MKWKDVKEKLHLEEGSVEYNYGGETMTELDENAPVDPVDQATEPEEQFPEEFVGDEVESEVDLNPEDFEEVEDDDV